MGAFELMRYLRKLKAAGFKNTELSMELQSRFASPLVNLIMALIGISVAARRSLGALRAGAVGVMVTALYWLVMTMGNALGLTGVLPHVAAAWLSPAIFTPAALWLFLTIPE
jgi:lipopolysaccharide export system permease protein